MVKNITADECRELIEKLAYEYGLDGMVLDLSNGWVLRDRDGMFVASGNDRVPATLCEYALSSQKETE